MVSSFLVRVVEPPVADGRMAGEVHVVATGERVTFRSSEELLALLASVPGQ